MPGGIALGLKPGEVIDISMIEQIAKRSKPFPPIPAWKGNLKNHLRTKAIFLTIKRITGFSCRHSKHAAQHPSRFFPEQWLPFTAIRLRNSR